MLRLQSVSSIDCVEFALSHKWHQGAICAALARQSVAQQALATAAQRLSRARSNTSSERSGSVQCKHLLQR